MVSYSIYETKARLSEVLRNVKKGAEVVLTERGVPIAKVIPFREVEDLGQHIQNLIANKNILLAEMICRQTLLRRPIAEAAGPPMRIGRHGKPRPASGWNAEGFHAG